MKDSGFRIETEQKRRVATFHNRRADGGLDPAPFEMPQRPEFFMGGGGAFSTPRDYMAFLQAVCTEKLNPDVVAMKSAKDRI
jgi:methyl acetate hydrolase